MRMPRYSDNVYISDHGLNDAITQLTGIRNFLGEIGEATYVGLNSPRRGECYAALVVLPQDEKKGCYILSWMDVLPNFPKDNLKNQGRLFLEHIFPKKRPYPAKFTIYFGSKGSDSSFNAEVKRRRLIPFSAFLGNNSPRYKKQVSPDPNSRYVELLRHAPSVPKKKKIAPPPLTQR